MIDFRFIMFINIAGMALGALAGNICMTTLNGFLFIGMILLGKE